jgi:Zn-dependent M28 family amino/carboxypeptidase
MGISGYAQYAFDDQTLVTNLKYLSSDQLGGRMVGTKESEQARQFIEHQFNNYGVGTMGNSYQSRFSFKKGIAVHEGVNVVGLIKGSGKAGSYLVVSAHYDHLGEKNDAIFNGADDNASGTCALFAISEFFQNNPPQNDIILVAFDAEEQGLKGAEAFVANPPVPLKKIAANINLDMVARADHGELVACGTFHYPQFKTILQKVPPEKNVKIIFGHDDPDHDKGANNWTKSSDHGVFHSVKIPFVYFGVEDHADYHKATDDFDRIDQNAYKSCVQLIIKSIALIDQQLN